MPEIITAAGVHYDCSFCGLASVGILYVDVVGETLASALERFGNANNTRRLTYRSAAGDTVYEGYTVILGVERVTGAVRVSLRRPYEGEVT